ncbi:hypothetical protein [Microcoleus sp. herbarium14]
MTTSVRQQLNDILSLFDRHLQLSIRFLTNRLPKVHRYALKRNAQP